MLFSLTAGDPLRQLIDMAISQKRQIISLNSVVDSLSSRMVPEAVKNDMHRVFEVVQSITERMNAIQSETSRFQDQLKADITDEVEHIMSIMEDTEEDIIQKIKVQKKTLMNTVNMLGRTSCRKSKRRYYPWNPSLMPCAMKQLRPNS